MSDIIGKPGPSTAVSRRATLKGLAATAGLLFWLSGKTGRR